MRRGGGQGQCGGAGGRGAGREVGGRQEVVASGATRALYVLVVLLVILEHQYYREAPACRPKCVARSATHIAVRYPSPWCITTLAYHGLGCRDTCPSTRHLQRTTHAQTSVKRDLAQRPTAGPHVTVLHLTPPPQASGWLRVPREAGHFVRGVCSSC
jgi:hypothetical protein